MIANVADRTGSRRETRFWERREPLLLALMLAVFALVSAGLWSSFETQFDSPAYTDPAASYVMGQGFTSGCWYFQGPDEFWAGNVPLHAALLIPWFKVFGFSAGSVWSLNLLYLLAGTVLIWRGMVRTGVVPSATWRLGAVAFFLAARCSLSLVIARRPDALCFLILGAAWYFLTLERPSRRRIALAGCGFLAVWASLNLAAFFALAGIGAVLFYGKRHFEEVAALAAGGALGAAALLGFYDRLGSLGAFIMNIAPHIGPHNGSPVRLGEDFAVFLRNYASWKGRMSGLSDGSALFVIGLAAGLAAAALKTGRSRKLAALNLACAVGIPAGLGAAGVFSYYYTFMLIVPVTVMSFGLLDGGLVQGPRGRGAVRLALCLSAVVPGSYLWCGVVQAVPSLRSHQYEQVSAFAREVIRPGDVAWVEPTFWFAVKPLARQVFSGLWKFQAETSPDRDRITVAIDYNDRRTVKYLPGTWEPTGEVLHWPDFHRFYRVDRNGELVDFLVFRRVDRH